MKILWAIRWFLGAALFIVSGHGLAGECATEIELAGHGNVIDLQLETGEGPINSLLLIPGNRTATGTYITREGDTVITGGRFIATNIETQTIETAIETPSIDGKPTSMSEVARSNNGKYILATGGYLFGGPALLYETEPSLRFLTSIQVTRNRLSRVADPVINLTARASGGDAWALAQLKHYFQNNAESLMDSWESDAEGFRNSIYEMYARQLNIPNKEEAVPVMGVQFHPDSQKFLVNSGESVSIRNSVDGRLLQGFSFNDFGVQHTMDPPLTFFIDKGNQVVAYSRQSMSLWDVKSGQPLDNVQRSDELLEGERPVSSPNAEYLSFVVKTDEGPIRQIWSGGENLQLVASYQTENPRHKNSAPEIAFSGNQIYALSKSPGLVELRDMKTHELIPNGEIRVGSSSESSEIEIVGLDTDYSGKWLVISASIENDLFLELWSIVHRKGVRLRVPKPSTPDRKQYLSRVEFDPSGDWFSVIVTEIEKLPPRPGVRYMGNAPDEYRTVKTTPYVVDVFKTIAKAK